MEIFKISKLKINYRCFSELVFDFFHFSMIYMWRILFIYWFSEVGWYLIDLIFLAWERQYTEGKGWEWNWEESVSSLLMTTASVWEHEYQSNGRNGFSMKQTDQQRRKLRNLHTQTQWIVVGILFLAIYIYIYTWELLFSIIITTTTQTSLSFSVEKKNFDTLCAKQRKQSNIQNYSSSSSFLIHYSF